MFLSTLTISQRDFALRAALMKKLLSKHIKMWYNVLGTASGEPKGEDGADARQVSERRRLPSRKTRAEPLSARTNVLGTASGEPKGEDGADARQEVPRYEKK